ncbi:UNVERIFIED_CONTAM: DUF917 family protein [Brevibacillus sp. OAP136]
MRKIGKQEIEDIAVGAALLGTGGGGDPYIGKLMALQAVEEFGPITLLSVDEVPDDALVVASGGMGAPTVLVEKIPSGEEITQTFAALGKYMGKEVFATFPIEAGGINSMLPLALAAKLGLPVVDVDGMGRAFPELQMTTFYLDGISATPMVLADEKGNITLMDTIDNTWTERIARSVTVQKGGSATCAIYPMYGRNLKESGIHHILTLEEEIGRALRLSKENNLNPVEEVLKLTKGYELFCGKVADVNRKTVGGFARGTAQLEGILAYKEQRLELSFQNEHLLAKSGDRVLCVTPDLIAVLDSETGMPITTEGLRYGARVIVIGIPCDAKWRTEKGLATCGPKYFGYDATYTPVEELSGKGVMAK